MMFSRINEIISIKKDKRVTIIGQGSVGSYCSIQLAKNGIHNFTLIDKDELSIENLSRHQGNIKDIGRNKARIMKDKLLLINPKARITTILENIEDIEMPVSDLIISCTDSNPAQFISNHYAVKKKFPAVFIGCYEKALSGEVIVYIPNKTPCLNCAVSFRFNIMNKKDNYGIIKGEQGLSICIEYISNIALMYCMAILQGKSHWSYKTFIKPLMPDKNMLFVNAGSGSRLFNFPFQVLQGRIKKGCSLCSS